MIQRNNLQLAALASAVMPDVAVAGVAETVSRPAPDVEAGIDRAVVRDAVGTAYDVYVTDTDAGKARLTARVRAARVLAAAPGPAALGFATDRVLAYVPGDGKGPTGSVAVMVLAHQEGAFRPLDRLSIDDCASMGTAIGAVHRLDPSFLRSAGYPVYGTEAIHRQLVAWIARLRHAGHVPAEITSGWERMVGTDGLWSFSTCLVHGGFDDGDALFSGSTVTAIGCWGDMQVNDPARDLGWIFSRLDEPRRDAVITAYGRMMGSRFDDLIMLRANLWVQMEQVGDFLTALARADTARIARYRAQVDRLAHQLGMLADGEGHAPRHARAGDRPPSTITVGTLLEENNRRRAAAPVPDDAPVDDDTADTDRTDASGRPAVRDDATLPDDTADRRPAGTADTTGTASPSDALTEVYAQNVPHGDLSAAPDGDAATIVIPLLEREERALRDARAGLERPDDAGRKATPTA